MPAEPFLRIEALVVDDDESVREVISSYFTKLGMTVTGASDGRGAIAALERSNGRFKVVVTDLSLPGADGLAVLKAARTANPSCYVVIVTGYASLDSAISAVRLGAHDYLTKPFSLASSTSSYGASPIARHSNGRTANSSASTARLVPGVPGWPPPSWATG